MTRPQNTVPATINQAVISDAEHPPQSLPFVEQPGFGRSLPADVWRLMAGGHNDRAVQLRLRCKWFTVKLRCKLIPI
jgi:hypothetical protein